MKRVYVAIIIRPVIVFRYLNDIVKELGIFGQILKIRFGQKNRDQL